MIEEREDATLNEKKSNQEKLKQLIESLNDGVSFEEMTKYSDDKGSAKIKENYNGLDQDRWSQSLKTQHLI